MVAFVTAKYWFEEFASIAVEVDIASEFRYQKLPLTGKETAIFVSQMGETADTMPALKKCQKPCLEYSYCREYHHLFACALVGGSLVHCSR